MSPVEKMTLYPIHAVGQPFLDDEPFDDSLLPAQVVPNVSIEKVAGLIASDTFDIMNRHLSPETIESFANIDYAIVHRFRSEIGSGEPEEQSMQLVRTLAALLRIVRPMRQRSFAIQGTLADGRFVPGPFEGPEDYVELPEAHKLFHLRPRDLIKFQQLAPVFLKLMEGESWNIRLAVQFHDLGYYTFQRYWKLSWFAWTAGLESLYTAEDAEHRGQLVLKERIKHVLGTNTSVYEEGDIPSFVEQPEQTVFGVIGPIYELRNIVTHGKRVPDSFYAQEGRVGLDRRLRRVEELVEALSFLLRKSIQVVLEPNRLDHFKDEGRMKAYFSSVGLTRTKLMRRREIAKILAQNAFPMDTAQILQVLNEQHTRSRKAFSIDQVRGWLGAAVEAGQIAVGEDGHYNLIIS